MGRVGRDRSMVHKTCKGTSDVDYLILSLCLFPYISVLEVLPFHPMISVDLNGPHSSIISNTIEIDQPF